MHTQETLKRVLKKSSSGSAGRSVAAIASSAKAGSAPSPERPIRMCGCASTDGRLRCLAILANCMWARRRSRRCPCSDRSRPEDISPRRFGGAATRRAQTQKSPDWRGSFGLFDHCKVIRKPILAEPEGFEPSMRLYTPYSLSRGAPSATRSQFLKATAIMPLLKRSVGPDRTLYAVRAPPIPYIFRRSRPRS